MLSLSADRAAAALDTCTPLLGSMAELDSTAVLSLIGALEQRFGITVDNDEISASTFETVGSLCDFVATMAMHGGPFDTPANVEYRLIPNSYVASRGHRPFAY